MKNNFPTVLIISGFDPSNQAGYGTDIKVASCLDTYPVGVITALTTQTSTVFKNIFPVDSKIIKNQLALILDTFLIKAVKIGMLYNTKNCRVVSSFLSKINCPVIIDPVLKSSTGKNLLKKESFPVYNELILKKSTLLTPNIPESRILCDLKSYDKKILCKNLYETYGVSILLKGGHGNKNISDVYYNGKIFISWNRKKIKGIDTHGSGCIISTAIAAFCAKGLNEYEAINEAQNYLSQRFKNNTIINGKRYL